MNAKNFFPQEATDELKLRFFNQLLEQDEPVRQQFEAFLANYADKLNVVLDDATAFMNQHKQDILIDIEAIDFSDIDYDDYPHQHGYYVPDYEMVDELCAQKLNEVLEGHIDACFEHLTSFRYDKAVLALVAYFEGSLYANIECDTTELKYELQHTFDQGLKKLCTALKQISIPDNQAIAIIQALLGRIQAEKEFNESLIKFVQPILDLAITNKNTATKFRQIYEQLKLSPPLLARNFVTAIKLEYGVEAWKTAALKWYKTDALIADELLQFFHKTDFQSFILTAESLWEADLFKDKFATYFYSNIKYEDSPELVKQVALYLTYHKTDAAYYQSVVMHLTINERYAFAEKCRYRDDLYLSLLAFDSRYDDALRHLETEVQLYKLPELITTISAARPHECFVLIRSKIRDTLQTAQSRETYQTIADTLKVAYNLIGYQAQTQNLINELYARIPALPSLKAILKEAGFLPRA